MAFLYDPSRSTTFDINVFVLFQLSVFDSYFISIHYRFVQVSIPCVFTSTDFSIILKEIVRWSFLNFVVNADVLLNSVEYNNYETDGRHENVLMAKYSFRFNIKYETTILPTIISSTAKYLQHHKWITHLVVNVLAQFVCIKTFIKRVFKSW